MAVSPDAHGQYAVYDSPYYPNFKTYVRDNEVLYYHLSPFATDANPGAHGRTSLDQGILGTVDYDVRSITANDRLYRDATWGIADILGTGENGDGKEHVADVYLYNLTLNSVVNNVETTTDVIDLVEGDILLLNNTGGEDIVWYYGKLTPCFEKDDLSDKINEKMNATCEGSTNTATADCIKNPKKYSISPVDMNNYLQDQAASSPQFVSQLTLKQNEKRIVDTVLQTTTTNPIILPLGPGEETATYLFYNPYSGKRMTVRVSKQTQNILLQINSFSPTTVSVQQGGSDNQLCIYNKDDVGRKVTYEAAGSGASTESVTIASGEQNCKQPSYFDTHKAKDILTGKYLIVGKDEIGSSNVISMLENITKAIAIPEDGANNPAYKFQILNPKAPATPSLITTELIDVDGLKTATDAQYGGIAREIETIEGVCRLELIQETAECVSIPPTQSENVVVPVQYDDIKLAGCCCRNAGPTTECKHEVTEQQCKDLKKSDSSWNYAQCPVGCCCKTDPTNGIKTCPPLSEAVCTDAEHKAGMYTYGYMCPTEAKVYKQRCISTLPFFIHIKSPDTNISTERIKAMKLAIDKVEGQLSTGALKDKEGNKLDMIGYVIVIDDPGVAKRGQCKISNYLDGLRNVSQYAVTKYGTPSMIIGFGLNRNSIESRSCWSNTELAAQAKQLFDEDIIMLIGSGVIGMGQYCLVDTSCQPVSASTGISDGSDYGLYYDPLTSATKPFGYGVNRPDVVIGVQSFSDYLRSLPASAFTGTTTVSGLTPAPISTNIGTIIPTGSNIYLNVKAMNKNTGEMSYSGVKPTGIGGFPSGGATLLPGETLAPVDLSMPGGSLIVSDQLSGLSGNTGLQNVDLISQYLGYLQSSGVDLGTYGGNMASLPDLMNNFGRLNDPSIVLAGTYRKDPFTRVWFDQCGKYYYEGEGQMINIFSESDIPQGQQGNQCDPSRMMELYKKYKCE